MADGGKQTIEATYWNFEPTPCRKVYVRMADTTEFPQFWGKHLLGQEVPAVEVGGGDKKFYLYDANGSAWSKVTSGRGGPNYGHASVPVADEETVRPRG